MSVTRKSHTVFRLVLTSVTLRDLERRNSTFGWTKIISPNSIASQAYYVTVIEDRPISFAEYRLPLVATTDPPCSAVSLR